MDIALISSEPYLNIGLQDIIFIWEKNTKVGVIKTKKVRKVEIRIKKEGSWVKDENVRIIKSEEIVVSKIAREKKERLRKQSWQFCQ